MNKQEIVFKKDKATLQVITKKKSHAQKIIKIKSEGDPLTLVCGKVGR